MPLRCVFLSVGCALPHIALRSFSGKPLHQSCASSRVETCLGLMAFTDQHLLDRSHALSPSALNLIRTFCPSKLGTFLLRYTLRRVCWGTLLDPTPRSEWRLVHPGSILTSRRFVLYWNFLAGIFLLSEESRLFHDGPCPRPTPDHRFSHISCGNRTQCFGGLCFALFQLATFSFPLHSLSPHQTFTDSSQEDMTDHDFPGCLGLARLNFWGLPHSQPG